MKKYLKNKNIKVIRLIKENNLGSLVRMVLSSVAIIFFFYAFPIIINFANSNFLNPEEYQNNSKSILAYTLNKKTLGPQNENQTLDERDLLIDILNLNDLETDTVRLDASTIKQLFKETDYKLDDVRKKKLVKPVALTLLPAEIKMIENLSKKLVPQL